MFTWGRQLFPAAILALIVAYPFAAMASVDGDVFPTTDRNCEGPPTLSVEDCNGIENPAGCELRVQGNDQVSIGSPNNFTIDLDDVPYFDPSKLSVSASPGGVVTVSSIVDCKFTVTGNNVGMAIIIVTYSDPDRGEYCEWADCVKVENPPDLTLSMPDDHYVVYERNLTPEEHLTDRWVPITVTMNRIAHADDVVRVSINKNNVTMWSRAYNNYQTPVQLVEGTDYRLLPHFHNNWGPSLNNHSPEDGYHKFGFWVRPEDISSTNQDTTITVAVGRFRAETEHASEVECFTDGDVSLSVVAIDSDVDSDNQGGISSNAASITIDTDEDQNEQSFPGRFVKISNDDFDQDGIPDYADGFGGPEEADPEDPLHQHYFTSGHPMEPLQVKLSPGLNASEAVIVISYSYANPARILFPPVPEPPPEPPPGEEPPPEVDDGPKPGADDAELPDPPNEYALTDAVNDNTMFRIWTTTEGRLLEREAFSTTPTQPENQHRYFTCYEVGDKANIQPGVRYKWSDIASGDSHTFYVDAVRTYNDYWLDPPALIVTVQVFPNERMAECLAELPEGEVSGPSSYWNGLVDQVRLFPYRLDVDADTNNTWQRVDAPSEPKLTYAEEFVEEEAPGVAVGLAANYDTSDPEGMHPDRAKSTFSTSEFARTAVMSKAQFGMHEYPADCYYVVEVPMVELPPPPPPAEGEEPPPQEQPETGYYRVWHQQSNTFTDVSNKVFKAPQIEVNGQNGIGYNLYLEGIVPTAGESSALTVAVYYDPEASTDEIGDLQLSENAIRLGDDSVMVTTVPVPMAVSNSQYFTPRMVEAPPYNVAKVDASIENSTSEWVRYALMVFNQGHYLNPEQLFYRYDINPADGIGIDLSSVYTGKKIFRVSQETWYANYDRVTPPEGETIYRFVWDGRQHGYAYVRPDLELDPADYSPDLHLDTEKPVWAVQAPTVGSSGGYYRALPISAVNRRPFARLTVHEKYEEINENGEPQEKYKDFQVNLTTCPVPLKAASDANGAPIWGSAPYWPIDHGINPFTGNITFSQGIGPSGGIGPVPNFSLTYNGNSWRHSPLGFGFTHNYEMRIMEVYHSSQSGRVDRLPEDDEEEEGSEGSEEEVDDGIRIESGYRSLYLSLSGDHVFRIYSDDHDLDGSAPDIFPPEGTDPSDPISPSLGARSYFLDEKSDLDIEMRIGYCYIFGALAYVYELPIDPMTGLTKGWRVETRDRMLYSFGPTGQIEEIEDRNGNVLSFTYSQFPSGDSDMVIKQLDRVHNDTGSLDLSLTYHSSAAEISQRFKLATAKFGSGGAERKYEFNYGEQPVDGQEYDDVMVASEMLVEIVDPEHNTTLEWNDLRRTGPAARIIHNNLAKRTLETPDSRAEDAIFVYEYEEVEDSELVNLFQRPQIVSCQLGEGSDAWMNVTVSGDASSRTITYGNGITKTYSYAEHGPVSSVTASKSGGSGTWSYSYNDLYQLTNTTVSGNPSISTTSEYDINGNLKTSQATGYGQTTYNYNGDEFNNVQETLQPLGRRFTYEYDDHGNVETITQHGDSTASTRTTEYAYNMNGSIDRTTDAKGRTVDYGYDSRGFLISKSRGSFSLLDRVCDAYGNTTISRDAKGQATEYSYDDWNRVTSTTARNDDVSSVDAYTALSQPIESTGFKAGASQAPTTRNQFSSSLKPQGYTVTGSTNGGGINYSYSYGSVDSEGNVLSQTVGQYTSSATYDYLNRQIRAEAGGEQLWSKQIDPSGQVTSSSDGEGNTTSYQYIGYGLQSRVTRPGPNGYIAMTYDALGNLKQTTDNNANGISAPTSYDHDIFNRVICTTDAAGEDWDTEYNEIDQVVGSNDPRGNQTDYVYDNTRDYLLRTELPGNDTIIRTVDDNGNVLTTRDPNGNSTSMQYNDMDYVRYVNPPEDAASTFEPNTYGAPLSGSVAGRTFLNQVDSLQRTVLIQPPGGSGTTPVEKEYDEAGLKMTKDRSGVETVISRDSSAKTTGTMVDNAISTVIDMDRNYNVRESTMPASNPGTYIERTRYRVRDAMQRVTDTINNSGAVFGQNYDGWSIARDGYNEAIGNFGVNINNLGLTTGTTVGTHSSAMTYDGARNVKTLKAPGKSTVTMNYNSRNVASSRSTPIGNGVTRSESFSLDDNQNPTSQGIGGLGSTGLQYDGLNRLKTLTNRDGVPKTIAYTNKGEVDSISSGGLVTDLDWDSEGRLQSVSATNQPSYSFDYDPASRPLRVMRGGSTIYRYTYDSIAKRPKTFQDEAGTLGGTVSVNLEPDATGYAWKRTVSVDGKQIFELTEPINDIGTLDSTSMAVGGQTRTVDLTLQNGTQIAQIIRPGAASTTSIGYNSNKETMLFNFGSHGSINIGRDTADGTVDSRTLGYLGGITESFSYNDVNWLTSETRDGVTTSYSIRQDGARTATNMDGLVSTYHRSSHGIVQGVDNASHGRKIRAPYEGRTWAFDDVNNSVDRLMHRIFVEYGTAPFDDAQVILLPPGTFADNIFIGATGCFDDDFNGGDAAFWYSQVTSNNGTIDLQQSATKQGQLGYAPRFYADNADYAYLRKDFVNLDGNGGGGGGKGKGGVRWHPEPDDLTTALPTLAESFWFYVDHSTLNGGNDKAAIFRGYTNIGITVDIYLAYENGQTVLKTEFQRGGSQGQPDVVDAGTVPVTVGSWHQVGLVYITDSIAGPAAGDGSFRWWFDGVIQHDESEMDLADDSRFISLDLGLISVSGAEVGLIVDDLGTGGLSPSAEHPLVIRSYRDQPTTLTGAITWCTQDYARLQGVTIDGPVEICDTAGSTLVSNIVRSDITIHDADAPQIVYNTFDYADGLHTLTLTDNIGAPLLRNNIVMNDGLVLGWTESGAIPADSDYNLYTSDPTVDGIQTVELNSLVGDPQFVTDSYYTNAKFAPQVNSGQAQPYLTADSRGWRRHAGSPTIGATEMQFETNTVGSGGRITQRNIQGLTYDYAYDGAGRLDSYTDAQEPERSATYIYDHAGRRVEMTVGAGTDQEVTTRFVYDGEDVCLEIVDENADNSPDRVRIYWLLQGMDRRIGFIDAELDAVGNVISSTAYYYLTDQVGSVIGIEDENGVLVNCYAYDAYGNIDEALTFEGVENRYCFQGREYDKHSEQYYFRMRTYLPEHGAFTGPDMRIALEPNGPANYLFADNNPMQIVDPTGLVAEDHHKLVQRFQKKLKLTDEAKAFLDPIRGWSENPSGYPAMVKINDDVPSPTHNYTRHNFYDDAVESVLIDMYGRDYRSQRIDEEQARRIIEEIDKQPFASAFNEAVKGGPDSVSKWFDTDGWRLVSTLNDDKLTLRAIERAAKSGNTEAQGYLAYLREVKGEARAARLRKLGGALAGAAILGSTFKVIQAANDPTLLNITQASAQTLEASNDALLIVGNGAIKKVASRAAVPLAVYTCVTDDIPTIVITTKEGAGLVKDATSNLPRNIAFGIREDIHLSDYQRMASDNYVNSRALPNEGRTNIDTKKEEDAFYNPRRTLTPGDILQLLEE